MTRTFWILLHVFIVNVFLETSTLYPSEQVPESDFDLITVIEERMRYCSGVHSEGEEVPGQADS